MSGVPTKGLMSLKLRQGEFAIRGVDDVLDDIKALLAESTDLLGPPTPSPQEVLGSVVVANQSRQPEDMQ